MGHRRQARDRPAHRAALNAFRKDVGLGPVHGIFRQYIHSPQRVIGLFPDWFAPPAADWPVQVRLTGFPLYDERGVTPISPDLRAFLDAGPPPIAFTFGSAMWHAHEFARAIGPCLHPAWPARPVAYPSPRAGSIASAGGGAACRFRAAQRIVAAMRGTGPSWRHRHHEPSPGGGDASTGFAPRPRSTGQRHARQPPGRRGLYSAKSATGPTPWRNGSAICWEAPTWK